MSLKPINALKILLILGHCGIISRHNMEQNDDDALLQKGG